jgi:hypothetical protein
MRASFFAILVGWWYDRLVVQSSIRGSRAMQPETDFMGPVVNIWCKDPAKGGMFLDVKMRKLGDRYFIVGTLAKYDENDSDERNGLTFWFPVDDVLMITEYPSLAIAKEAYARHQERKKQSEPNNSQPPKRGFFR